MKLSCHIILTLALVACNGILQNTYEELFSHATSKYPNLNRINWEINYSNSIKWGNGHYDIEAMGNKNDTIYGITFAIFPSERDTFVNIIEYVELYSRFNYKYYTSYDSAFIPIYKYKYNEENPDSLIFIFGEEKFFEGGTY
jgi:hypothetical protein